MSSVIRAAPLPREQIPARGAPEWAPWMRALVSEAFARARQGATVPKRRRHGRPEDESAVDCGVSPVSATEPSSRLRSAHWHTRESVHTPAHSGVSFDAFARGLLRDHTPQEPEYIGGLERVECIETLQERVAAIWRCSYKMPFLVSNREFVELVVTLALPPHAQPFSEAHERAALAWPHLLDGTEPPAPQAGERRAFLVISVPVLHADAAIGSTRYLRAYYASVEAVWEDASDAPVKPTRWMYVPANRSPTDRRSMTLQTDSAGWIPLWMQEVRSLLPHTALTQQVMMPDKIVEVRACGTARSSPAGRPQLCTLGREALPGCSVARRRPVWLIWHKFVVLVHRSWLLLHQPKQVVGALRRLRSTLRRRVLAEQVHVARRLLRCGRVQSAGQHG